MTTSTHTHVCPDEEVMSASKKALESGRITPLLKVELWAKIQARRLSEGKEEMQVDFEKSPHSCTEVCSYNIYNGRSVVADRNVRSSTFDCNIFWQRRKFLLNLFFKVRIIIMSR